MVLLQMEVGAVDASRPDQQTSVMEVMRMFHALSSYWWVRTIC
jgi:hypothetical protein